jgi:hypothetical protein
MSRNLQVFWQDKRGAGHMRSYSSTDECARFMSTLRREAVVRENGEVVGGIEPSDGRVDDQRIKWLWWFA